MRNLKPVKLLLELESSGKSMKRIEKLLNNLKEALMMRTDVYYNIMIAMNEAITNAIVHGNKNDRSKPINLQVLHNRNWCVFTVEDQGKGFDHRKLKDPTKQEKLLAAHGRGIFIMKQLSQAVRFHKNGSSVSMYFRM